MSPLPPNSQTNSCLTDVQSLSFQPLFERYSMQSSEGLFPPLFGWFRIQCPARVGTTTWSDVQIQWPSGRPSHAPSQTFFRAGVKFSTAAYCVGFLVSASRPPKEKQCSRASCQFRRVSMYLNVLKNSSVRRSKVIFFYGNFLYSLARRQVNDLCRNIDLKLFYQASQVLFE